MAKFTEAYWQKIHNYLASMNKDAELVIKCESVEIEYPTFWERLFNQKQYTHPKAVFELSLALTVNDEVIMYLGSSRIRPGDTMTIAGIAVDISRMIQTGENENQ